MLTSIVLSYYTAIPKCMLELIHKIERMSQMRTEKEMLHLILDYAKKDDRILAVLMNGSRVDPTIIPDSYQDYDIVYVVEDPQAFINQPSWIAYFGERLLMQCPTQMDFDQGKPVAFTKEYAYLMLFQDGNRIDLTLKSLPFAMQEYHAATLVKVLLDKQQLFEIKECSNREYYVARMDATSFANCCNEFWWVMQNVGKGLVREELPYALRMRECYVRDMLHNMIDWYIGCCHKFEVAPGKCGKFYQRYLPAPLWQRYVQTYSLAQTEEIWRSGWVLCDLFHDLALTVAETLHFSYRQQEEDGLRHYLAILRDEG